MNKLVARRKVLLSSDVKKYLWLIQIVCNGSMIDLISYNDKITPHLVFIPNGYYIPPSYLKSKDDKVHYHLYRCFSFRDKDHEIINIKEFIKLIHG